MNNALSMLNMLSQEEMHKKLDILQESSDDALEKIDVTVQMVSKVSQELYQEQGKRPTSPAQTSDRLASSFRGAGDFSAES